MARWVYGSRWLPSALLATLALLSGLTSVLFSPLVRPTTVSLTDHTAYASRLEGRLLEHQGLLYQHVVAPRADLQPHLERLGRDLEEGANWLQGAAQQGAAVALQAYLTQSVAIRGASDPGVALGSLHDAAERARKELFAVTEGYRTAAVQEESPADLPFWILSAALGLLAILSAPWTEEPPEPAEPRTDQPDPEDLAAEADALHERIRSMRHGAAQTWQAASGLLQGVGLIGGAVNAHAGDLGSLQTEARRLAGALREVAVSERARPRYSQQAVDVVEGLSDRVQVVGQWVDEARGAAAHIEQQAQTAAENALAALEAIDHLAVQAGQSGERLRGLTERAGHIEEIVTAIKGIADQANMLALNAAIEAAHAGERGRGFAVVADSVRRLSGRVQQHAREIELRLSGISEIALQSTESVEWQQAATEEISLSVRGAKERLEELAASAAEHGARAGELEREASALLQVGREAATTLLRCDVSSVQFTALEEAARHLTERTAAMALRAGEEALAVEESRRTAAELTARLQQLANTATR